MPSDGNNKHDPLGQVSYKQPLNSPHISAKTTMYTIFYFKNVGVQSTSLLNELFEKS